MLSVDLWTFVCECGWRVESQRTVNNQQSLAEVLIRLHLRTHESARTVAAVDPSAADPGTPTTRESIGGGMIPHPDVIALMDEARRLLNDITPGEWHAATTPHPEAVRLKKEAVSVYGPGCLIYSMARDYSTLPETFERQKRDAEFIAEAPRLLRDLLSVIDQQGQHLEMLSKENVELRELTQDRISLQPMADPLAASYVLDDLIAERHMYHTLVADIRTVLGEDGLHAQLLDLPKVISVVIDQRPHPDEQDAITKQKERHEDARMDIPKPSPQHIAAGNNQTDSAFVSDAQALSKYAQHLPDCPEYRNVYGPWCGAPRASFPEPMRCDIERGHIIDHHNGSHSWPNRDCTCGLAALLILLSRQDGQQQEEDRTSLLCECGHGRNEHAAKCRECSDCEMFVLDYPNR